MSEQNVAAPAAEPADRVAELEGKLRAAEASLAEAREALDSTERKRAIERELTKEGAIDLETVSLLTEAAVAGMEKADVGAAVAKLKRRKPFLFRGLSGARASAMSGEAGTPRNGLEDAAATARESGDRRALLRYLRMRREGRQ